MLKKENNLFKRTLAKESVWSVVPQFMMENALTVMTLKNDSYVLSKYQKNPIQV